MISGNFDWKNGSVVFWDLDTMDESRPLADQTEHLKEDLAQIEYPAGVLIKAAPGRYGADACK